MRAFDKKFSNSLELHYLEPSLYFSITDVLEANNTLIQERHNHGECCIRLEISRGTQKIDIGHANEGSGLAFFSKDLEHFFGHNVDKELGVMLGGKRPTSPTRLCLRTCPHTLPYDIQRPD